MNILALAIFTALCIACLVTAMAVNRWGLTAAAAVGSALGGSAMHLMLERSTAHPSRFDEWVIIIADQDRLPARAME